MDSKVKKISVSKLMIYMLHHVRLIILLVLLCFGGSYVFTAFLLPDVYTATGAFYVNNGNTEAQDSNYVSTYDLEAGYYLIDTYVAVIKSKSIMEEVADKLRDRYSGISSQKVKNSLAFNKVEKTGVCNLTSTTEDAQLSADIVNTVLDVIPDDVINVTNAGSIGIIDNAIAPKKPNERHASRNGALGGIAGLLLAFIALFISFLFNQKITEPQELIDYYTPTILSVIQYSIKKRAKGKTDYSDLILSDSSSFSVSDSFARLRLNLLCTLKDKDKKVVAITSSIRNEGKSTIAANLAISFAKSGRRVLLVDNDLHWSSLYKIFGYDKSANGLAEVLEGKLEWPSAVIKGVMKNLDLLPSGTLVSNPEELLESAMLSGLLKELDRTYDIVLLDTTAVNAATDLLSMSKQITGCVMVIRGSYSDHQNLSKALIASEMAGLEVLGFVMN